MQGSENMQASCTGGNSSSSGEILNSQPVLVCAPALVTEGLQHLLIHLQSPPFWHQRSVSWKTIFPQTQGGGGIMMWG